MEQHKHGNIFRERDVDRIVAQYSRKPPKEVKDRAMEDLKAQRRKFRFEQWRSQERGNSQGRSL